MTVNNGLCIASGHRFLRAAVLLLEISFQPIIYLFMDFVFAFVLVVCVWSHQLVSNCRHHRCQWPPSMSPSVMWTMCSVLKLMVLTLLSYVILCNASSRTNIALLFDTVRTDFSATKDLWMFVGKKGTQTVKKTFFPSRTYRGVQRRRSVHTNIAPAFNEHQTPNTKYI